ncbi:MAG TPA: hypothetical protein VGP51_00165 [Nocardioidaceae bacterium]|jgi:hypothetical protein|nr:hypothetical protein [Nocardioidaceae bacterium]
MRRSPAPELTAGPTAAFGPWLRWRVAALRGSTRQRRFTASVEVADAGRAAGLPAPAGWLCPAETLDHALRVEVLLRLLAPGGRLAVVLVRPGRHDPGDDDYAWLAAAPVAADVASAQLCAVVVLSRWGWLDLLTGEQRSWVRLRPPDGSQSSGQVCTGSLECMYLP